MIECRTILFAESDLIDALIAYARKRNLKLPSGTVRGAAPRLSGSGEVEVVLTVRDDHGADHEAVFDQANAGSALVNYCLERSIRLPRSGNKSIRLFENEIGLVIYLNSVPMKRRSAAAPATAVAEQVPAG